MKILRFSLMILLAVCGTVPVFAQDDLQALLARPEITIGDYELAKDDLAAFYAARDNRPAWNFGGPENAAAFAKFLDTLQQVINYHGLPPEDYPVDLMKTLAAQNSGSGAELELLVTDTLLRLAHALHGDIVDLGDLYPGWNFHRTEMDIPAGLAAAVADNILESYIGGLAPKNPAYAQLADALKSYRDIAARGGWIAIDPGLKLQPKDRGPRVAQLRSRLAAENYMDIDIKSKKGELVFGEALRKALIDYQLRNGLNADGQAGSKTLAALNIPVAIRIDQIRANMERWRHMPDDFPPATYAQVNIPDALIQIIEDGTAVYQGPVIVGRVDRKTPFIQSTIRSMIFNPIWHVPSKIAREDILPKLRADPHYLEKLGFVIKGSADDPYGDKIDWKSMPTQEFNFRLRQSPGDMNSLGRLKFDFDNDFAVYMHGTPHQELFGKYERDLSSGCVRLRDPEEVAQILLAGNKEPWPLDRIEEQINSKKTRWIAIEKPLPVFFVYWTVFTDDVGKISFRNDMYGYDSFLMQSLNADVKTEPPKLPQTLPSVMPDSSGH